jgi:hypothetical protein
MKVNFILIAEGSSDLRLVEHIERILIEEGFEEARGEAPDLGRFRQPIGTTVREKIQAVVKYFPSAEIVFIHGCGPRHPLNGENRADYPGQDARNLAFG